MWTVSSAWARSAFNVAKCEIESMQASVVHACASDCGVQHAPQTCLVKRDLRTQTSAALRDFMVLAHRRRSDTTVSSRHHSFAKVSECVHHVPAAMGIPARPAMGSSCQILNISATGTCPYHPVALHALCFTANTMPSAVECTFLQQTRGDSDRMPLESKLHCAVLAMGHTYGPGCS